MKSLEIQLLLVKKGYILRQNFLLAIIPSFVTSLKKFLFAFLVKELHLILVPLQKIKCYPDGQFKYLFFALDFLIASYLFLF